MLRVTIAATLVAGSLAASGAALRAGAARVDITPEKAQWLMGYEARQSSGVLDRIYHRAVALEAGGRQFYLVSSDLCLFSPGVYEEAARELEKEFGIARQDFWWSVMHSHATPEVGPPGIYRALLGRSDHEWDREYQSLVLKALVEAVRSARSKLEPARIRFGEGMSLANINRRAVDVDGKVSIGLNPDGPADRQIGLIRLERPDGSPIALVANYAMHGTVMNGQNLRISGDAPGTVTAYLEKKLGGTVLFVNGAAGDLAPIYSVYPDARSGHLTEFAVLLGDKILAAVRTMEPGTGEASLWTGGRAVGTPLKQGLAWPDELGVYGGLPVRLLRINDAVIWAAPVELFCEIAMEVRRESPFVHTFYFGYTNGWLGYLPTAKAFAEGGYETRTTPFTPQAEGDVKREIAGAIKSLAADKRR